MGRSFLKNSFRKGTKDKMDKGSNYVLQADAKSICPECGEPVDLLCRNSIARFRPAFYICWFCQKISEVALGPVKDERPKG